MCPSTHAFQPHCTKAEQHSSFGKKWVNWICTQHFVAVSFFSRGVSLQLWRDQNIGHCHAAEWSLMYMVQHESACVLETIFVQSLMAVCLSGRT